MKLRTWQFNLILVCGVALLGAGCAAPAPDAKNVKHPTVLHFHLEVNPDGTDKNGPVQVNRSVPFTVNVQKEPFLTQVNVTDASVVDDSYGGFFIKVQLNRQGTWLLEQYSTANKGKRVAVFTQFDDTDRWLAAPILQDRIANGVFSFTADVSRTEAERIVLGLNELGKDVKWDDR